MNSPLGFLLPQVAVVVSARHPPIELLRWSLEGESIASRLRATADSLRSANDLMQRANRDNYFNFLHDWGTLFTLVSERENRVNREILPTRSSFSAAEADHVRR